MYKFKTKAHVVREMNYYRLAFWDCLKQKWNGAGKILSIGETVLRSGHTEENGSHSKEWP